MEEFVQIIQEAQGLLICVALVVGGLQCFFGYKLFRAMTAIIGFVVGGAIGGVIGGIMAGEGGALLGALVLGVLGALLAYSLYQLGVFVICFGAGAMVGLMLATMMGSTDSNGTLTFMIFCGLILGVVGIIITKPIIILSTGIGGGMSMGFALGTLIDETAGVVLGVILSVIGVFVQFYLEKEKSANGEPAADHKTSVGSSPSAAPRSYQFDALFTIDNIKMLTKEDLTSAQAVCGAVVWGLLGLGIFGFSLFGIIVNAALIAIGLCVGGCANQAEIEYFTFGDEDIQNARVLGGGGIGFLIGLFGAITMSKYVGFGTRLWCVIFWTKVGAIIGYLLEMKKNYKAVQHIAALKAAPPASTSNFYKESPDAPSSVSEDGPSDGPSSGFYNETPSPSSGFYNKTPPTPPVVPAPELPAAREDALVSSSARLWTQGLPIVFTGISIFPSEDDPTLLSLSLTFQNIGDQPVIGVYLGVNCRNLLRQELESLDKLTIQDFVLEPGESKTYICPKTLPDSDTRRVELIVRHVVMADDSTWDREDGKVLTALEDQPPLQLDEHLKQQFLRECNEQTRYYAYSLFKFQPQELEGGWRCACGQLNQGKSCVFCGIPRGDLFTRVDLNHLQKSYDLEQEKEARYREEQRKREEERQRQLEEERQRQLEEQKRAEEERRRIEEEERRRIEAAKPLNPVNSAPAEETPSSPRPIPTPRFCTSCGQPLEAVAKFCPNCGRALY